MRDLLTRARRSGPAAVAAMALMNPLAAVAQTTAAPAARAPAESTQTAPAGAPIPLELNKLEPVTQPAAGCRVYFVISNPDSEPFEQFRLDLIMFGTDGVIARRIALDLGPLQAKKQGVRLFDMQGLPCDQIGKVLVNDVIACSHTANSAGTDAEREACLERLSLSSRAKATLTK